MAHLDFGHVAELLIATLTFWGIMYGFRREDRKERQHIRETAEAERLRQHQENQAKLDEIVTVNKFHPPHLHTERAGNLTFEGMRVYKKEDSE